MDFPVELLKKEIDHFLAFPTLTGQAPFFVAGCWMPFAFPSSQAVVKISLIAQLAGRAAQLAGMSPEEMAAPWDQGSSPELVPPVVFS